MMQDIVYSIWKLYFQLITGSKTHLSFQVFPWLQKASSNIPLKSQATKTYGQP